MTSVTLSDMTKPASWPRQEPASKHAVHACTCHAAIDGCLSRIGAVSITTKLFERPRGYAPQDGAATDHRPITVRVLFAPEAAPWVREQPNYFTTEMREAGDGLLVTLHVRDEIEIFQWVLGWGAQARVMEPESLRQRVLAESKKVLELLT